MLLLVIGVVGVIFGILLLQSLMMYVEGGENDEMEKYVDGEDEIL